VNPSSTANAVRRLRQALEAIGDALTSGNLAPLLDGELRLSQALADLAALDPAEPLSRHDSAHIREEIAAARQALERVRRLGASLTDFVAGTLSAEERSGGYARDGQAAILAPAGALRTRA
jgi:hypothetical protein